MRVRGTLKTFRLVAIGGVFLFSQLVLAAVDKAVLQQADALLKSGKAEEAYRMLEPLEVGNAGDILFDYLLATAALESGKPSKATFVYERILAVDPTYVGVRADMGRAYFALGDFGRAKIEFETVLTVQNLPPDLRSQVVQYVAAAEARALSKRTLMTGYMELGYGRDSNIGSATSLSALNLPASGAYVPAPPTGTKVADNYATLGLGGEINHQLSDKWGAFVGGDYRARDYRLYNDPNSSTIDLRAGLGYSGGAWLLRSGLTTGAYYYHGQRLRNTVGATMDWRKALDKSSQLTANGSFSRAKYVPVSSNTQHSDTYTGSLGWLTAIGDGTTVFNVSGTGGYERATANRDDGDRRFLGPRVMLQKSFNNTLGGYITAGATHSVYKGINTSYLKSRRETLYDMTLALSWQLAKSVSLRPQVAYSRNNSNTELYSYNKTDVSANLRFDF